MYDFVRCLFVLRLEAALREISDFQEADGSGHAPAKCPSIEKQGLEILETDKQIESSSKPKSFEENAHDATCMKTQPKSIWKEKTKRHAKPAKRERSELPS